MVVAVRSVHYVDLDLKLYAPPSCFCVFGFIRRLKPACVAWSGGGTRGGVGKKDARTIERSSEWLACFPRHPKITRTVVLTVLLLCFCCCNYFIISHTFQFLYSPLLCRGCARYDALLLLLWYRLRYHIITHSLLAHSSRVLGIQHK